MSNILRAQQGQVPSNINWGNIASSIANFADYATTPESKVQSEYSSPGRFVMAPGQSEEDKILQTVLGEHAINKIRAPKLTPSQIKEKIVQDEISTSAASPDRMPASSPLPPQAMAKYQKEADKDYQQLVKAYMQKQQDLARNAEERAKLLGENFKPQVDLSAAFNFLDGMHGTNYARGYKAPESGAERMAKIQGFENQSAKAHAGLTDDAMNMLRHKLMEDQYAKKNAIELMKAQNGGELGEKDLHRFRVDLSKSKDYEKMKSITKLQESANRYRDLVNTYGLTPVGENAAKLENAYRDFFIAYKDAAGLGAITGPDQAIVEGSLSPSSGSGVIGTLFKGGKEGILNQLDGINSTLEADFKNAYNSAANTFPMDAVRPQMMNMQNSFNRARGSGGSSQADQARQWAMQNPNDPRAQKILSIVGN